jgi:hypothetical protein
MGQTEPVRQAGENGSLDRNVPLLKGLRTGETSPIADMADWRLY